MCLDSLNVTHSRQQKFDQVFKSVYKDWKAYKCEQCHNNTIRLFKAFKDQIPNLKASEFKVLYITTPEWINNFLDRDAFHVKQARSGYVNGEVALFINWKFHVVLEYRGRIYDLDNSNKPRPSDSHHYLEDFFMDKSLIEEYSGQIRGDREELLVFVIPGDQYLSVSPEYTNNIEFHKSLFKKNTPVPLVPYLERNRN